MSDQIPPAGWGQPGQAPPPWDTAAKDTRPWYKKKRFLIPAGLFGLLIFAGAAGGGAEESDNLTGAQSAVSAPPSPSSIPSPTIDPAAEAAAAAQKAAADKAAADKAALDKAAADKAAAEAAAAKNGPADQQGVVKAVVDGRAAFEASDNELRQRQIQTARDKAICDALPSKKIKSWVGEIKTLDTNGEGKGILDLQIAEGIKVGTWNNALSDIGSETLIPGDSALFNTLVNMKKGDRVRFSGTFLPDDKSCIDEKSLTLIGQMKTPSFVFRFSEVSKI